MHRWNRNTSIIIREMIYDKRWLFFVQFSDQHLHAFSTFVNVIFLILRISSSVSIFTHQLTHWDLGKMADKFADDIFQCIFLNENCWILIKISLKYVRKGPIDNDRALVQIMAWCLHGDKPFSEPMMVRLLTHMCVIRPQWIKLIRTTPNVT